MLSIRLRLLYLFGFWFLDDFYSINNYPFLACFCEDLLPFQFLQNFLFSEKTTRTVEHFQICSSLLLLSYFLFCLTHLFNLKHVAVGWGQSVNANISCSWKKRKTQDGFSYVNREKPDKERNVWLEMSFINEQHLQKLNDFFCVNFIDRPLIKSLKGFIVTVPRDFHFNSMLLHKFEQTSWKTARGMCQQIN